MSGSVLLELVLVEVAVVDVELELVHVVKVDVILVLFVELEGRQCAGHADGGLGGPEEDVDVGDVGVDDVLVDEVELELEILR